MRYGRLTSGCHRRYRYPDNFDCNRAGILFGKPTSIASSRLHEHVSVYILNIYKILTKMCVLVRYLVIFL